MSTKSPPASRPLLAVKAMGQYPKEVNHSTPTAGTSPSDTSESGEGGLEQRRRFIRLVVCSAGLLALFFMLFHLLVGRVELALVSLSALLAALLIMVVLRFTRSHEPAVVVATAYAAGVTLWLLSSPSFPPADALWCLVVPLFVPYAGGVRMARWILPLYLVAVGVTVFAPGFVNDSLWRQLEMRERFLGLLALVSFTAWVYEETRNRAQLRLQAEIEERRAAQSALARSNAHLAETLEHATRLAQQAEVASEAKTRFLSQMSHDIRTPLTGILGMAELLELTNLDSKQRGYLRTIRVSGEALAELIGDILDLSRIEAGRLDLRVEEFTPRRLLEDVRTVVEPLALSKGLLLNTEIDPALPERLVGDPAQLRRIVLNLAGNAVKFTDRGEVTLGARCSDSQHLWRIQVSDTGPGIPTEQHKRIFESFNQGDHLPSHIRAGSGLGLAICARLTELMGGEMRLESELGRGSTFWVDLPRVTSTTQRQTLLNQQALLPAPTGLRLLVVDDSETVRRVVVSLMTRSGHLVTEAPNALEALDCLTKASFDAVFMDVQMPEVSGIEATIRLRRGEPRVLQPDIPIIAVTALADPDTRRQCLEAGMCVVVTKPVETGTLLGALAVALTGNGQS